MKILIAEDDPAFRRFMEETLVRWGYEVVVTNDGNEAWQALKAGDAPQTAILDWMMPGMDGVELCRKIRKETKGPYIYIILLTSQQKDEDLVAGMEAGADDYITKPFKTNELRVRLNAGKRMIELQNELTARASDLEEANRELESFSYSVSHDLRSPLVWIGGYCRSILKHHGDRLDEGPREHLREICEGTQRMEQLIDALLDLSQLAQGELTRESVDLSEIAKSVAEKLMSAEPGRRVAFRIAEGIAGTGDQRLLRVVLENLLGNAWKYTSEQEDAVIEFGVTNCEGKQAYFVRDNGAGFDMACAEKLFVPFQRLHGTDKFKGHGIGLATVKRIISRHKGEIWAESRAGKGATFYFTLDGDRTI